MRRRELGRRLRELRTTAGVTRDAIAELLEMSVSNINRIENGQSGLRQKDLRALMDFLNVDDAEVRLHLERLRAEGKQRGWYSKYRSALRDSYRIFIGLESEAAELDEFAAVIVPGLLQTRDYATAVMEAAIPQLPEEVIKQRLDVRMQRQQRLTDGLRVHSILDEGCISRQVGGPDVWRAQLVHLIEMAGRRNVTVQILPHRVGAHASVLGGFSLLHFGDGGRIAYVELVSGDLFAEGDDAARYGQQFDALRTAALPPTDSVREIERLLGKV